MVFNAYSAFVNNFSIAMETAKKQARSKPAFADFLKVCLYLKVICCITHIAVLFLLNYILEILDKSI